MSTQLQHALEAVELLSLDDREFCVDVLKRRIAERRREEIARHAAATLRTVREGRARYGTLGDLERDLLEET
jgi:hypothetical protein